MADPKRALVSLALGREVLRQAVTALAPAGIPVLPLKGVWLQACAYSADEPRMITDVDLLVPEDAFERAVARLERARFQRGARNVSEQTLTHPDLGLPVDLHRRLFTPGAFRLPTADLFRRSRRDAAVFGVEVRMPDPRDVFAHLVGHFVKSRTRLDDATRLADFVVVTERCGIAPADYAHHLEATGLARAARYALHELAYPRAHPPIRSLLQALPPDAVGEQLARFARTIAGGPFRRSTVASVSGFMLDASIPAGARTLLLRVLDLGLGRPVP